jgi:hypothetical protein
VDASSARDKRNSRSAWPEQAVIELRFGTTPVVVALPHVRSVMDEDADDRVLPQGIRMNTVTLATWQCLPKLSDKNTVLLEAVKERLEKASVIVVLWSNTMETAQLALFWKLLSAPVAVNPFLRIMFVPILEGSGPTVPDLSEETRHAIRASVYNGLCGQLEDDWCHMGHGPAVNRHVLKKIVHLATSGVRLDGGALENVQGAGVMEVAKFIEADQRSRQHAALRSLAHRLELMDLLSTNLTNFDAKLRSKWLAKLQELVFEKLSDALPAAVFGDLDACVTAVTTALAQVKSVQLGALGMVLPPLVLERMLTESLRPALSMVPLWHLRAKNRPEQVRRSFFIKQVIEEQENSPLLQEFQKLLKGDAEDKWQRLYALNDLVR